MREYNTDKLKVIKIAQKVDGRTLIVYSASVSKAYAGASCYEANSESGQTVLKQDRSHSVHH